MTIPGGKTSKGARRALACALCAALLLCLICARPPAAFAAGKTYLFDISQGPVTVANGSTAKTLRVFYGPGTPQASQDLILPDDTIVITGPSRSHSISVETTRRARIVLEAVTIDRSLKGDNACPFSLIPGANVVLGLYEKNTLTGGPSHAGIRVPPGASLEIVSDGVSVAGPGNATMDIVLVIDRSGSMNSDRMAVTKNAAVLFCTELLDQVPNARIAVTAFDSTASVISGFSSSISDLEEKINGISAGGNTNPYSGLVEADKLLQSISSNGGHVVMLSDGTPSLPDSPNIADDAINIAAQMMQKHSMYTLGVLLKNNTLAEQFLRQCQNKGYYDVADLSDMQSVFADIGEDIVTSTIGPGTLTAISAAPAAGTEIGGAGIGGNDGESAGSITIRGGDVTARSGGYGAGIGGGRGGSGGRFLLEGGVVIARSSPSGDAFGAGVGGGKNGSGGSIALRDGYLFACSAANGDGYGAGLGSGAYGASGGEIAITHVKELEAYSARGKGKGCGAGLGGGFQSPGGTIVITEFERIKAASAMSEAQSLGADIGAGHENGNHGNQLILTNSANGDYLMGQVVLPAAIERYTISARDKLIIPAGASLTVPANVTLTNDGIIENYGALRNDSKIVNNGRVDNFADLRGNGQIIRNEGSFFNGDSPVPPPDKTSYFGRTPAWSTPSGGGSSHSLPAADDREWVDYNLSGTAATLYLTPQKAEEIARNSEDGTADLDLSGIDVTEWSFPKAALAYFAGRGLAVEFKTPLGVLRLDRTAAADIAEQGGGD
ncbi:MAG: VWA domain-containing protein, partial [Clostridiales Family XIII bacterium]|nr:VWA domain-containing protein [Clostridiales Family XIII bacterium]